MLLEDDPLYAAPCQQASCTSTQLVPDGITFASLGPSHKEEPLKLYVFRVPSVIDTSQILRLSSCYKSIIITLR
eukprot:m.153038 g.153038  ORF g.153038 m.153038 type:complete len:74 (+) comp16366_c0_seq4:522-743(+)